MPLNATNRPIFEKLRKEYNIVFADECRRSEWPDNHRDVFEAIEKLKGFKYDTYHVGQTGDDPTPAALWKVETKRRASKLPGKAKDLVSRNEATWRLACENIVFGRLASEVACKICRNRVWRSEVEASAEGSDRVASTLRLRQEKRDSCRCPVTTYLSHEDPRASLDRLFIDRAEDWVEHPPELAEQLPQDQKPDRTYGLRQTKNIEELLQKSLPNGTLVEKLLHKQPHDATLGQPLLFPFLVVEAKAGNAPDDWHSIRLQTAFPVYTYLNTQQSLRSATAQRSRWTSGPLVWFFMNRGDDWRLCLAYQSEAASSHHPTLGRPGHITNIAQVWAGCITNRDDALQLLLIVDYMSDWARDIYRTAVITELRILAAADADASTIFTDTDIFSSLNRMTTALVVDDDTEVSRQQRNSVQAAFKILDSNLGVVRHAAPIESRFRALFITEANVQMFVKLADRIRVSFVDLILDQFLSNSADSAALALDQLDSLDSLEEVWTGHVRAGRSLSASETKFYSAHVVTYYLSPLWEQIRELCVISISDEALDILVAEFQLEAREKIGADNHSNTGSSFLKTMAEIKAARIDENLAACISSLCGRVQRYTNPYAGEKGYVPDLELGYQGWGRELQPCDAAVWETVSYIEETQKTSPLKIGGPLFYSSSSLEVQPSNPTTLYSSPVLGQIERLQISRQAAVLVHGDVFGLPESSSSSLCVYLLRESTEPPSQDELGRIIKQTFKDRGVYHTTRSNGKLDPKSQDLYQGLWNLDLYRGLWDLDRVYGVPFSYEGKSFVKWLQELGQALPKRQGSSLGPYDAGRRTLWPEYPRQGLPPKPKESEDPWTNSFLRGLLVADATAWAQIAQAHIKVRPARCPSASYIPQCLRKRIHRIAMSYSDMPKGHDPGVLMSTTPGSQAPGSENIGGSPQPAKSVADNSHAIKKGLCPFCERFVGMRSSWPAAWERIVRIVVRRVISASVARNGTLSSTPESCCISTPRGLAPGIPPDALQESARVDRSKSPPSVCDTDSEDTDSCQWGNTSTLPANAESATMVIGASHQTQDTTRGDILSELDKMAWTRQVEKSRGRKRRRVSDPDE